jgi:hypothetical protein
MSPARGRLLGVMGALLGLACWIALIAVAWHFVVKYW